MCSAYSGTKSARATPACPTSTTAIATPSAPPSWRVAWFTALPTAYCAGGRPATAAPASEGSTMPTPVPLSSTAGSHCVR